MRYPAIIIIILCSLVTSCGKPPLLNKLEKNIQEISRNVLLSEYFPKEHIEFTFNWTNPPNLDDVSSFSIELGSPLKDNQTLSAFIWMPDMGHGSSPIEVEKINATSYSFTEVAFIMPGAWVLHVEILENNQVVDKWQKPIVL